MFNYFASAGSCVSVRFCVGVCVCVSVVFHVNVCELPRGPFFVIRIGDVFANSCSCVILMFLRFCFFAGYVCSCSGFVMFIGDSDFVSCLLS